MVEFNGGLSRPSPISQSPIVSYEWVFFDGTGTQATGINPTHTFAPPPSGTGPLPYTVQLRVVDANGQEAYRTQPVPLPDPPVVPPLINQLPTPPAVDANRPVGTDDVVVDVTNALDLTNEGSVVNFQLSPLLLQDNPGFSGTSPTLPLTLDATSTFNAPAPPAPGLELTQYVVLDTVLPNGNNQTKVVAVQEDGTVAELTRSPVPLSSPHKQAVVGSELIVDPVTGKERYSKFTISFSATGSEDGQGNLLSTTSTQIDPVEYGLATQNAAQTNLTYLWSTSDPALTIDGANNRPYMEAFTTTPGTYEVTLRVLNPTTELEDTKTITVTVGVQQPVEPDVRFLPLGGNTFAVVTQHGASNTTGLHPLTRVVVWDGINSTQQDPLYDQVLADGRHFGVFDIENDGVHNLLVETVHA